MPANSQLTQLKQGVNEKIFGARSRIHEIFGLKVWKPQSQLQVGAPSAVCKLCGLIPDCFQSEAHDPVDQLRVGKIGLERRLREILVRREHGIWICLDEIDFVFGRQTQIDASVAINREQAINAFAGQLDFGNNGRIESFRELVLQTPAFSIFLVPLRLVGGDFRFVGRDFFENEFANRKYIKPMISENADVKFTAFDVFLGNHVIVQTLVNELDAILELFVRFHKGGLRNAKRRFFLQRFDQNGKFQSARSRDPFAARNNDKGRRVNPVIAKNFFGNALVLAQSQPGAAATGERHSLHREKRNDVLIEGAIIFELIGEIENDVRLETLQFLAEQIQIVKDGKMFDGMAERTGFRFPIVRFQFRAQILINRGRRNRVKQREDF